MPIAHHARTANTLLVFAAIELSTADMNSCSWGYGKFHVLLTCSLEVYCLYVEAAMIPGDALREERVCLDH